MPRYLLLCERNRPNRPESRELIMVEAEDDKVMLAYLKDYIDDPKSGSYLKSLACLKLVSDTWSIFDNDGEPIEKIDVSKFFGAEDYSTAAGKISYNDVGLLDPRSDVQKVRLNQTCQCFQKTGPNSSLLARTDLVISRGEEVYLGPIKTMVYDHKDVFVFPFRYQGQTRFLLYDEVQPSLEMSVM